MEFVIALDNCSIVPLHRQLYEEIRQSILTGRLSAGARVPSTRTFAKSLGVSRSTVTQSYDQLISEGYLQTAVGSGTRVSPQLPEELLQTAPLKTEFRTKPVRSVGARLSQYALSLSDLAPFEPLESRLPIHFKTGLPALDQFPMQIWRRLLLRHCRANPAQLLDYTSDSQGEPELRAAIADYLRRSRAVSCSADHVLIVNGSQQAIDLTAKLLIDRGDTVVVENPGYLGARRAFLAQGAKLHPAAVDQAGIDVDGLHKSLARPGRPAGWAKLIYVTPSHQFPTGAMLSLPRRLELISWAAQTGAVIVEDDYDSEFRYCGRPIPALQGLDEHENVVYVGTFSKVLFPALRVGYLVAPPSLIRLLTRARWLADRHTPTLEQRTLADFINEGHLERHLRRMRLLYEGRRAALTRALTQHFGERVSVLGENAGMHLMARFKTRSSDDEVVQRAKAAGVGLVSAQTYYLSAPRGGEFVLGYANLSERKIQEGVRRLANILK